MKILTVSDFGVKTGFARVMESIIEHFPEDWEIHSLAINYHGDHYESRAKLYPARLGGDLYGIQRIEPLIKSIEPDRIFVLQDSWIIKEYLERIPKEYLDKVIIYTPVDAGPYVPSWLEKYPLVKQVCAYTEFGKKTLLEANPDIKNIKIIPHGVDLSRFHPIDQDEARDILAKVPKEDFVVLNVN
jgi:glycosyltransferase involved in cell wall biosynthesis